VWAHAYTRQFVKIERPFPFRDFPKELRLRVLEHAGLIIDTDEQADPPLNCFEGVGTCDNCGGYGEDETSGAEDGTPVGGNTSCLCSNRNRLSFTSSCLCDVPHSLPVFMVNQEIREDVLKIYYFKNSFCMEGTTSETLR
jgi:hypothetical protein